MSLGFRARFNIQLMPIINSILSWFITKRQYQIDFFRKFPVEVQNETLAKLLKFGTDTAFGEEHGFSSINSYTDFKNQVPVRDYDSFKVYIEKAMSGEDNVLFPGEVRWFAKSSGTTSEKSKFIPITRENMEECHFRGGKDAIVLYLGNNPESKLFKGKSLVIGGSHQISNYNSDSYFGDLSAVLLQNMPFWGHILRTPDLSIALMDEWEEKIEKMADATIKESVSNIAGVPSWTLVLMNRIMEKTGVNNIHEVWPKLELFMHGGVSFDPYKQQFKKIFPASSMKYMETYNASEGFFGLQDDPATDDMLLMLDYGVYYEFIPMEYWDSDDPKVLPIEDVEMGENYAIVISTSAGLWRYKIGDTVKFTSLKPYKIKITGRTKHFINAFGEEVIIDNADKALRKACQITGAEVAEYTAAPVFMKDGNSGKHQWLIEFSTPPDSLEYFTEILDNTLKANNSDYEAKRYKDIALHRPDVITVRNGIFYQWLKANNKLGGQHKVPRLSNNRKIIEEILEINK